MKITFLDVDTLGADISLKELSLLEGIGEVSEYDFTPSHVVTERLKTTDIVITNKVKITKEIMDDCPIKLICVAATGMNNIDLAAAKEKNIIVKNVSGYSTQSVVQITMSHVMFLLNQHSFYDEYAKKKWHESLIFTNLERPFNELAGKRWGIIGLGTIGKKVAEVATSFGCEVVYYSTSGKNNCNDYQKVELDDLLSTCKIISIHSPLNENTQNLIDKKALSRIKENSILVNVGRGGIIDEEALAEEIDKRKIYAGIDVVAEEPINKNNPLLKISHKDRISITPHIAWASIESRKKLIKGIIKNIEDFLKNC